MRFHEADLLPAEVLWVTRNANAVVDVVDIRPVRGRLNRSMIRVGLPRADGNGALPARHSSTRTGSRPSDPQ